jgi:hypothetical protein
MQKYTLDPSWSEQAVSKSMLPVDPSCKQPGPPRDDNLTVPIQPAKISEQEYRILRRDIRDGSMSFQDIRD